METCYDLWDAEACRDRGILTEWEYKHNPYRLYVVEITETGPLVLGWDGGEPEDQTLYRDWEWVVPALNAAYAKGRQARPVPIT